ncbi:unnamed protein product [Rotaria magnacalcarata]|uniref:Tetratricopeptide repeat protein n=2 Tax=Rotaria magnacalcarata TaxID=392030 RepID=A0A815TSS1_9BILA|nr:unnamed protein product [Rotaria magnacalcarata]CAF1660774.1 unnamed protein product [Rotaria magnacalcarata]CAF1949870.1 unnamed protein product [Rotaria magnacalcarata]CAF3901412.1 unnamed protein product [Rotaria magnacalcarata]
MQIDSSKISTSITPFALIDEHSALPQEQEILFTMHTAFRVVEIKQTAKNSRLWEVQLTITGDNDAQFSILTNRINEKIDGRGWRRMGKLMLQVDHLDQAKELYNELLENASNDSDRAFIYHHLGRIKWQHKQYEKAITFYKESLEIYRKILPKDDVSLATIYNNIALAYNNMDDYSEALEFYEKSFKIREKALPPNHPSLTISNWCIGDVYRKIGDYSKALLFLEKALGIFRKSLPSTHPHIKKLMNSIEELKINFKCSFSLVSAQ